jgi:peptidoglycan/xylan/chitin deacetylase (PgdA/CDA1 family)
MMKNEKKQNEKGLFVISLDFELYWGIKDSKPFSSPYLNNIKEVKNVVPNLLDKFDQYGVKTTFAIVGMLFLRSFDDLEHKKPKELPAYSKTSFSPYLRFDEFKSYDNDCFFAPDLIKQIIKTGKHEIASHTYSHYYCLEKGQTLEQFRDDLLLANQVAEEQGITLKSLIFPRNQFNKEYLQICKELGYTSVRSVERGWAYQATNQEGNKLTKRAVKLLDSYLNITGHHIYALSELVNDEVIEIPSSSFLRPYSRKLSFLDSLRLYRITSSMTAAAKQKKIFHLWWHPHNMGANQAENMLFLDKILQHYKKLKEEYDFESITMKELAEKI